MVRRCNAFKQGSQHPNWEGMTKLFDTPEKQIAARPAVRAWLVFMAVLVFAMVIVGGATRLTDSGLSITEWQPILGAIPPLNEADWQEALEKYRQIPEYQLINKGMSLADFKFIYWWEWGHRFLGRFIGIAFFVPLMFFWLTGRLERSQLPRLLGLFVLGGLQGALGWYMVMSGLVERTDVSQYRLSAHLTLATVIFAALVWTAMGYGNTRRPAAWTVPLGSGAFAVVLLVIAQTALGGFVAGLDAGMAYNTWPLMDGKIIPDGLMVMDPAWRNLFENALTVQFQHRMAAYLITGVVIWQGSARHGRRQPAGGAHVCHGHVAGGFRPGGAGHLDSRGAGADFAWPAAPGRRARAAHGKPVACARLVDLANGQTVIARPGGLTVPHELHSAN
jgi:cytochrome c oxidase assembly protein subunit 15